MAEYVNIGDEVPAAPAATLTSARYSHGRRIAGCIAVERTTAAE